MRLPYSFRSRANRAANFLVDPIEKPTSQLLRCFPIAFWIVADVKDLVRIQMR